MDFITAIFLIFISAELLQLSSCHPWGRYAAPDPNQGVGCSQTPGFGSYCDKYGTGQIKSCSPCNIDQLSNSDISFPEECANVPCPYRCPEDISDTASPAPRESCDITTTSLTTNDLTTALSSTTAATTTATTTKFETPTDAPPGTTTIQPNEPHDWVLLAGVIGGVSTAIVFFLIAICVWWRRKHKCKRAVPTSSSTEPMIVSTCNNSIEMTPPQTPTSSVPVVIPGETSVAITSTESDLYAKLDCECAGDGPIHIGSEGVTLEGLIPSARYHVSMGTMQEGVFCPEHHNVIETGETQPDLDSCYSLQNLKQHIESKPSDFQSLKALFGHIGVETAQDLSILRGLSKVLGVAYLGDVAGLKLLEGMIDADSQLKGEEDSVKLYSIMQALVVNVGTQVPDFVIKISQKLSSIHRDCVPCKHQVCQLTRNLTETRV